MAETNGAVRDSTGIGNDHPPQNPIRDEVLR